MINIHICDFYVPSVQRLWDSKVYSWILTATNEEGMTVTNFDSESTVEAILSRQAKEAFVEKFADSNPDFDITDYFVENTEYSLVMIGTEYPDVQMWIEEALG